MKVDLDTLIYIVITILVLVISGLGKRKKRRLDEMNVNRAPGSLNDNPDVAESSKEIRFKPSDQQTSADPFQRIEQLFGVQEPQYESMDEEEQIMEEIENRQEDLRKSQEEFSFDREEPQPDEEVVADEKDIIQKRTKTEPDRPILFNECGEIKKLIIYNEILNRKY